jgi:hypothetical protein
MTGSGTVFGDVIVSATLLNRRSGEILDQAWEKCVTIMRNDQAFALLRREDAREMTARLHFAQKIVELFHALELRRSGAAIDPGNEFEWISAFGAKDLTDMASEVYSGYARAARREGPLAEVDALIHEWQESAWALRSADVKTAFDAPADEVPITEPAGYAGR